MGTEHIQTKALVDCPRRNTEIYFSRHEFCSDAIIISPSTRFAMIRIFSFERPAYCYWLNDDVISIFDENKKKQKFVHYFYQIDLDDPKSRLQLITKCDYPYQSPSRSFVDMSGNVCKITINNHDFLFVKAFHFILVPYNLLALGPHLPLLKMTLPIGWIKGEGEEYFADLNTAFAFRDKVYFRLKNDECLYDRFQQVDIHDFDLLARKATFTLDLENAMIFVPRKLNQGSYIANYGGEMSMDGPLVLFYENTQSPTTMDPRKIWLLNLENGTILEKIIEKQPFTVATMYRGFLILWDMHKSTMKYHWINNHVPALSDICRVTVSAYNHQPQSWLRQCKSKTKKFVNRYRF